MFDSISIWKYSWSSLNRHSCCKKTALLMFAFTNPVWTLLLQVENHSWPVSGQLQVNLSQTPSGPALAALERFQHQKNKWNSAGLGPANHAYLKEVFCLQGCPPFKGLTVVVINRLIYLIINRNQNTSHPVCLQTAAKVNQPILIVRTDLINVTKGNNLLQTFI